MLKLVILSFIILFGGIIISIYFYGIQSCWSDYGELWKEKSPKGLNIWSAINIISAFCLIPPMIEQGVNSMLQFLGFFAPLFLFLVGFTPDYKQTKTKNLIHQIGAWGSVLMVSIWLIYICNCWYVVLPCFILGLLGMIITHSKITDWMLWGEMAMFLSVYLSLLIK